MWTTKNRGRYERSQLRYPSDLTDDEWARIEPLISPAKRGGNRRHVDVREVMNGIMYVLSTGCQWRAIPKDLPPRSTVFHYFDRWSWDFAAASRQKPECCAPALFSSTPCRLRRRTDAQRVSSDDARRCYK